MDKDYLISKFKTKGFKNILKVQNYFIHYNNIRITTSEKHDTLVVLLGDAIDCRYTDKSVNQIVDILSNNSLNDFFYDTRYLLGRYLIMRIDNDDNKIILPDATCSVPVYYQHNNINGSISSSSRKLAEMCKLKLSSQAEKIKKRAGEQHPLPYNITMYDELNLLIPNHYLNLSDMNMIRFFPNAEIEKKSFNYVVDETLNVLDKVIDRVAKEKELIMPLTAGIDSRTLLALFKDHIDRIPLYTFYDKGNEDIWDIKIPKLMTEQMNLKYYTIERNRLTDEKFNQYKTLLDGQQNRKILENGFTLFNSHLNNKSFLAGDIIPIAKSNFGKNLPERFATLGYLVTKTHNYSKENRMFIKKWMNSAENSYKVSLFDLFFWEHRVGRWLPNNASNYDIYTDPLYLFNCRYLIELWISIDRDERIVNSLHKEIISRRWPELMEFPVNPDKSRTDKLFSNAYAYYIGSFIKYFINRFNY